MRSIIQALLDKSRAAMKEADEARAGSDARLQAMAKAEAFYEAAKVVEAAANKVAA